MDSLSLIDFWQMVESRSHHPANRGMRYGQIAFNLLWRYRPDIAMQIEGTDNDPFHVNTPMFDRRFLRFCDYLLDNWEK